MWHQLIVNDRANVISTKDGVSDGKTYESKASLQEFNGLLLRSNHLSMLPRCVAHAGTVKPITSTLNAKNFDKFQIFFLMNQNTWSKDAQKGSSWSYRGLCPTCRIPKI